MHRDPKRLRDLAEKLADRYYEGPEPPSRIASLVVQFAQANPNATVEAWAEFATRMASSMYRSGWTRGFEWRSRNLTLEPEDSPERREEAAANDWQQEVPTLPSTATKAVEGSLYEQLADEDARVRYLDLLGRYYGGYRVIIDTSK